MGKKASVPNRRYTEEFRTEAVRLAQSIGGNAAAKRLGIPQSTVTNWVRRNREGTAAGAVEGAPVPVKRPVSELEAENARLRRELASAKLDLEIVKNGLRAASRAPSCEKHAALHCQAPESGRQLFGGTTPSKNLAQGKLRTRCWWRFIRPRLGK